MFSDSQFYENSWYDDSNEFFEWTLPGTTHKCTKKPNNTRDKYQMNLLSGHDHDRELNVLRHFLSFWISNCNYSLGIEIDNFLVGHEFGSCVPPVHMREEILSYRYHTWLHYQHCEFLNDFFQSYQIGADKKALQRIRACEPIRERTPGNNLKTNLNWSSHLYSFPHSSQVYESTVCWSLQWLTRLSLAPVYSQFGSRHLKMNSLWHLFSCALNPR